MDRLHWETRRLLPAPVFESVLSANRPDDGVARCRVEKAEKEWGCLREKNVLP